MTMTVITTEQVVQAFGDPQSLILPDGSVSSVWERRTLSPFTLPAGIPLSGHPGLMVTHVNCHRLIVPFARAAFQSLFNAGAWDLLNDFGGCYCWRTQRAAPAVRSRHAWGIALDLNVGDNPFLSPPNMPSPVVQAFKAQGFAWGGDFIRRPDGMHFEFADLGRLG